MAAGVVAGAVALAGPAAATTTAPAARATAASRTAAAHMTAAHMTAAHTAAGLAAASARPAAVPRWLTRAPAAAALGARPMTGRPAAIYGPGFEGAVLYGVSCPSRTWCVATGLAGSNHGRTGRSLAERWNGTRWAVQSIPQPSAGGGYTAGVWCGSPKACVSTGISYGSAQRLIGAGWNGRRWAQQRSSLAVNLYYLYGMTCTRRSDCMSVGARGNGTTLAAHWNGSGWSGTGAPGTGALESVACPARGQCTAVAATAAGRSFAERWNGRTWSVQPVANPRRATLLLGVTCPGTSNCMAVGTAGPGASSAPLAERWNGRTWSALSVADPAAGDYAELRSVTCRSATSCVAVGDAVGANAGYDKAVAARWNGHSWSLMAVPSPATYSALTSVSCTSSTHCVAVGAHSATITGTASPLVEVWNGTAWTVQSAPR